MKAFFIGRKEYIPVLRLQESLLQAKIARQTEIRRGKSHLNPFPDTTILVEHASPVYTLGRRDTSEGLPADRDPSVQIVKTKRGGGITYHGPGQVTMYPIANIQQLWKDCTGEKQRSPIEWFSEVLEKSMMGTAEKFGIATYPFKTGVWTKGNDGEKDSKKIGSIGLQLGSNWTSMHGAAFNVSTDLSYFDKIIMCELPGRSATSLVEVLRTRAQEAKNLISPPDVPTVAQILYHQFLHYLSNSNKANWMDWNDLSSEKDWIDSILIETLGVEKAKEIKRQLLAE